MRRKRVIVGALSASLATSISLAALAGAAGQTPGAANYRSSQKAPDDLFSVPPPYPQLSWSTKKRARQKCLSVEKEVPSVGLRQKSPPAHDVDLSGYLLRAESQRSASQVFDYYVRELR